MCREADETQDTPRAMPQEGRSVGQSRRGVLGAVARIGMAALAAAAGLWTIATGRFLVPNAVIERRFRFKIGLPGAYPPGHVETRFQHQFGVWVVHGRYRGRWQLYALSTACTHLGCATSWQSSQQKFKCPCHGSGFTVDGMNSEGPAPRPLPRYAIRVADDGQLEVDRSRTFREELGQWEDAACYVEVEQCGRPNGRQARPLRGIT